MRLALQPSRLLLATAMAGGLALATSGIAMAQEHRPREPMISVSAEGEAAVAPDMAVVNLSVVRNGATAEAALAENSSAMSEILTALRAEGVAERDAQTSNFSIYPQYRQSEPKDGVVEPPVIVGYEVSNSLTVRVRDLSNLGSLLDKSVKLGVNQGGQISFTNDNPEETVTAARKDAVAKALAKAKTLTEAAGVKLGPIVEISENSGQPLPMPVARMSAAKAMDSVPVAAGENNYTVSVNITFRLEP